MSRPYISKETRHCMNMLCQRYSGIDYDLHVINAGNKDATPEQLRDCIHDALERLDERLNAIEAYLVDKEDVKCS